MTGEVIELEDTRDTEAQSRALGSSFYLAMRIMPRRQREAMFEIYSFCRAVDDIADDQGAVEPRLLRLERWRDHIDAIYRGEKRPHLGG
jgi:presqualene diphosphate synthase